MGLMVTLKATDHRFNNTYDNDGTSEAFQELSNGTRSQTQSEQMLLGKGAYRLAGLGLAQTCLCEKLREVRVACDCLAQSVGFWLEWP